MITSASPDHPIFEVTRSNRAPRDVRANLGPIPMPSPDAPSLTGDAHYDASDDTLDPTLIGETSELAGGWRPDGRYFEVVLPHTIHYKCIGKIKCSDGESSATLIGPRLILTAGHCVMPAAAGNVTYKDISFCPGYPRGEWYRVTHLAVHRSWATGGVFQGDIAIGLLDRVASPDLWFGIKCNLGVDVGHAVYGYPDLPPFDGERCIGDSGYPTNEPWKAPNDWTPSPLRFNLDACSTIDLTPGCSGGPWVGDAMREGKVARESQPPSGRGSGLYITGLNSFMYGRYPGIMISPYFGDDIFRFCRFAIQTLEA